jgi:uncharacterized protein
MPLPSFQFVNALKALPFVEAIYLFGSRARGTSSPQSDIDLAVVCPTAGAAEWQAVLDIIETADTLLKIDCVRLDREKPDSQLRMNVEREKEVLYERNRTG